MAFLSARRPWDALWGGRTSVPGMGVTQRARSALVGLTPGGAFPAKRPSDPFGMVSATKRHGGGNEYQYGNMTQPIRYREIQSTWTIHHRDKDGRITETRFDHQPVQGEPLFCLDTKSLVDAPGWETDVLDELSSPCPLTVMNARLAHDHRLRPSALFPPPAEAEDKGDAGQGDLENEVKGDPGAEADLDTGHVDARAVSGIIRFVGFLQTNPPPSGLRAEFNEDTDSRVVTVAGYCREALDLWPDSATPGDSIGFLFALVDRKKMTGAAPRPYDAICSYANIYGDILRQHANEEHGRLNTVPDLEDCYFQLIAIDATVSPSNALALCGGVNPALLPLDVMHTAGLVKVAEDAQGDDEPVYQPAQGHNVLVDEVAAFETNEEDKQVVVDEDEDVTRTKQAKPVREHKGPWRLATWTCEYVHVGFVVFRNQTVMGLNQTREAAAAYLHASGRDAALQAIPNIGQFNPSVAPRPVPELF